jgi:hypothetical protein
LIKPIGMDETLKYFQSEHRSSYNFMNLSKIMNLVFSCRKIHKVRGSSTWIGA